VPEVGRGASLRRVTIRAYQPGPPAMATVEAAGTTGMLFDVAVSHNLPASLVTTGSAALVVLFDDLNPEDGVLAAVW